MYLHVGHRSTLLKAFRREQIPVAARRPREMPQRTPEHKAERYRVAKRFAIKPPRYYVKELDLIIDNTPSMCPPLSGRASV